MCENADVNGNVSEKIITSLQAHSMPIYWESKTIENEFNPKCFINANNYTNSQLVDKISEIDNSPDKWEEMVSAPWRINIQIQQQREIDEF